MDLSSMTTYVAALSVSTGRVTESVKRFPEFLGVFFVDPQTGTAEDVRMICVHVLAVMIGGVSAKGQIRNLGTTRIMSKGPSE